MSVEPDLDKHLPVTKGERLEGFPCPKCGKEYSKLMDCPSVKSVGYNTRSGLLFDCICCNKRTTEAEIRIGEPNPWNNGLMDDFEPDRDRYINPESEYDKRRGVV